MGSDHPWNSVRELVTRPAGHVYASVQHCSAYIASAGYALFGLDYLSDDGLSRNTTDVGTLG
uniref:Uncharacterized protein n=1 Tax=mine drainage metagenome TaxID=410659 RepID=E6QLL1_9ZZZZ